MAQTEQVNEYLDGRMCQSTVRQAHSALATRQAAAARTPMQQAEQQFERLPTVKKMTQQRKSLFHPSRTGAGRPRGRPGASHSAAHANTGGDLAVLADWSHSLPRLRARMLSIQVRVGESQTCWTVWVITDQRVLTEMGSAQARTRVPCKVAQPRRVP